MSDQKLYSTKEAAKFLGVSVRTLKYWRKNGKLVPEIKGANGKRGGRGKGAKYTLEQLKRVQSSEKRVQTLLGSCHPFRKRCKSGQTADSASADCHQTFAQWFDISG